MLYISTSTQLLYSPITCPNMFFAGFPNFFFFEPFWSKKENYCKIIFNRSKNSPLLASLLVSNVCFCIVDLVVCMEPVCDLMDWSCLIHTKSVLYLILYSATQEGRCVFHLLKIKQKQPNFKVLGPIPQKLGVFFTPPWGLGPILLNFLSLRP